MFIIGLIRKHIFFMFRVNFSDCNSCRLAVLGSGNIFPANFQFDISSRFNPDFPLNLRDWNNIRIIHDLPSICLDIAVSYRHYYYNTVQIEMEACFLLIQNKNSMDFSMLFWLICLIYGDCCYSSVKISRS